jgi:tryptophan-rich sensory protein
LRALAIFALQLVLNAAWTPLFFGLHRPDLAFLEIMVLWVSILATIVLFYPIHSGAALLLVPALNLAVWRLNPSAGAP